MASLGVPVNEGRVVLDPVMQRKLVEVEAHVVATEKDASKRQQGCEGQRQLVDCANGTYESPEADVFAVVRTAEPELLLNK